MPHRTAFVEDLGVVVLRLTGEIGLPEIENALSEIPAQPWFRPHLKMIADTCQCTTAMMGEDVQAIAAHARHLDPAWGETQWAVLATSDLIYGLARVYMAVTADFQVHTQVFRTTREASEWLELGVDINEALRRAG